MEIISENQTQKVPKTAKMGGREFFDTVSANDFVNLWNRMVKISLPSGVAVQGGLCWDVFTAERLKDEKCLERYGYKVYSQNDEDGMIQEIFRRIGVTNRTFIEFGVQDGLESNCHLLLFQGWTGLWIEGSKKYVGEIQIKFKPVIRSGQLKVVNAFITRDNINDLFSKAGFSGEIDLLSIDIDGNDFYVWQAITSVNPRVVVIEYNGKFPPHIDWKMAYNESHAWYGSDWHGASLKAMETLGREKGYRLVGTNLRGVNAFFVREDLAGDAFCPNSTAEALYNPLRCDLQFRSGHAAQYCLAVQEEGAGIYNYFDTGLKGRIQLLRRVRPVYHFLKKIRHTLIGV